MGGLEPPRPLLATLLLRMVAPGAGFCNDTGSGVSWSHLLPCDASEAVTDLSENYVQMRMETKKNLHRQMGIETKKKRSSPQIGSFRPD